ncbi:MAG: hypothetical protein M5R36_24605 [Deltaproteobacteria bacterium]|nr:hypothetical protein [Deltaproteobacteria bacterium]
MFRMTQEEGVMAIAYMIIGCPHEKTKPQIMQVHDYLMDIAPNYVVYSLFTPYPDAPAFQDGVDAGLWPADCWEKFMLDPRENHGLPTAWEEHLSKAELLQVFKEINRKFYFHPKTLFRTALNLSTFSELRRVVRGGISLIKLESLKVDEQLI